MPKMIELFDLSQTQASLFLSNYESPWEAVPKIKECVLALIQTLDKNLYYEHAPDVWIAKSALISPNCIINPPCIIGERTELRNGAFIRGGVLIGNDCVIGNSSEFKNCIVFNEAQIPHFNYVGDSIIGYRAHLGAGAVTSNVKSDKTPVSVSLPSGRVNTGLKKLGALVGDFAEVGCHAVLNPGTILSRRCSVYPLSSVRGFVPENCIYKNAEQIVERI